MTASDSASPWLRRAARLGVPLALLLPWLLFVALAYVSFTFPIKHDRYGHSFSSHMKDRGLAYVYLLSSPWKSQNAHMPVERIRAIIDEAAARGGVDPCLVHAVVLYESAYDANTITTTGAMGLMALMPATARHFGITDPYDPERNVEGGTRLIRELLALFQGNVDLALAAYNAGAQRVQSGAGIPPLRETVDYVAHVKEIYGVCRRQGALPS